MGRGELVFLILEVVWCCARDVCSWSSGEQV